VTAGAPHPGGWERALTDFESCLQAHQDDFETAPAFVPPPALGPLPAVLRERAEALLARSLQVQAQHEVRLASLARAERLTAVLTRRAPARPGLVDVAG